MTTNSTARYIVQTQSRGILEFDELPQTTYYSQGLGDPNDVGYGYLHTYDPHTCLIPIIDTQTGKQLRIPPLRERIVNYYRTANCDRYGQLKTVDAHQIAKSSDDMKELGELIGLQTYGYGYGTYKGFSPWGAFKCEELEKECQGAFAKNKSRNNQNNW
jgi:hypothetical protein